MNNFDAVKEWWNQAPSRDQLAIVALGGVVGVYLLYAVLLKPASNMLEKQLRTNNAQMEALERVRDLAGQWMSRGGGKSESGKGSIVEIVNNSLREHKLRLNNMQPSNNGVRLRLESAEFNSLLAWLNQMEVQQRLQIRDLSIAGGKDSGMVSANLRLQKD